MDDRNDRPEPRDGEGRRDQPDPGPRDAPRGDGGGPDTRFLQLELSQVMYGEAESVVRPAFRELLLEAAKERLRERFGDRIARLAQLAVDEEVRGFEASLEIETRIRDHQEQRRPPADELREALAARPGRAQPRARRAAKRTPRRGRGK